VIETVLPSQNQRAPPPAHSRRILFYNFGVVDSDVMIPATNLSFAIKGGYRCAWEPIEMTPPSSGASAAELGSWNLEVESGNVEASEDGAWCIPQIQATFNGKVVGTALHVGDITKTNGTAFIAVLGGIGRGPLQLKGYAPKRPFPLRCLYHSLKHPPRPTLYILQTECEKYRDSPRWTAAHCSA
jgi:hypothetical protein